ncbi:MAG TPA: hypothetical protein VGE25_02925 [Sediminibacterium sp.]
MKEKFLRIKIDGIEILDKKLNQVKSISEDQEFRFEIKAQLSAQVEKRLAIVFSQVNIKKDDDDTILASLTIACGFSIPEIEEHFLIEKSGVKIPKEIDLMLRSMTISTMRGILFSELRGTVLHKAYLPMIAPQTMTIDVIPIVETK